MFSKVHSQDLDAHRWKQRVLLVIADNVNDPKLDKQLEEWRSNNEGLNERKLVIYQIFPESYKQGLDEETEIIKPSIYQRYNTGAVPFQVVLLGLDGGVKYQKSELLKNNSLLALIDGMPMRRSELSKNE